MISNELNLQRCQQGITLVPSLKNGSISYGITVQKLLRLPVNIYFMDRNSIMKRLNDQTAETCGYVSSIDAIGKSIRDVSKGEATKRILCNDKEIIDSGKYKIITESYIRHDDLPLTAISIKFPWLQSDKIIGILGISVLLGYENSPSLTDAFTLLMEAGLLTPTLNASDELSLGVWECKGQYFDQRDKEILFWLVRGKTAKHIANKLALSYRTIEHRLEAIKQKLNVSSKSELIEFVVDKFLIPPKGI